MSDFKSLGLSEPLLRVLDELGFETPTEIQSEAIPVLLSDDYNMIGLAQTGTGKTAAFGLPLLEKIDPDFKATQAIILAPTRELCKQIAEQLAIFSKYYSKISTLPVYGGAAISNQIKDLKKTQQIVIATPGRLIDLIKRKAIKLNSIRFVVLDEADEMLNMGFKEELDEILSHTPEDKNTWLFSATMPSFIKKIVKKYMDDPVEIRVNQTNEVNKNIEHQFAIVRRSDKPEGLRRFLDLHPTMKALVFCKTRADTKELADILLAKNYRADVLNGDLTQQRRDRVMKRFKNQELQILVATDVAARGIDVNDLTHVFHFNIPNELAYYTHRSGRTARAGKEGVSIAFIGRRDGRKITELEKKLGITFSKIEIPGAKEILDIRLKTWAALLEKTEISIGDNTQLRDNVHDQLSALSKEELIDKLLSIEMANLSSNDRNLNEKDRSSRGDRDERKVRSRRERGEREAYSRGKANKKSKRDSAESRSDRPDSKKKREASKDKKEKYSDKDKSQEFFINVGTRDKISKRDLVDFISEVGEIKRNAIGKVRLKKSHSFFELDAKTFKKVQHKFKDVELYDGRKLKVNKE